MTSIPPGPPPSGYDGPLPSRRAPRDTAGYAGPVVAESQTLPRPF